MSVRPKRAESATWAGEQSRTGGRRNGGAREGLWTAFCAMGLGGLLTLGCADPSFESPALGGAAGDSSSSSGGASTGGQPAIDADQDFPRGISRYRRLTHAQWEQTVQDLLGLKEPTGLSASFRADPKQSGYLFDGYADALEVDQVLWQSYQRASALIARDLIETEGSLDSWLPAEGTDEERVTTFIKKLGKRAHRRPLSRSQVDDYLRVFEAGTTGFSDTPGFQGGLRLVIEAFLQSPHFLYRVEQSEAVEDGIIPLDGWERATRLSYFLWGTMPDSELFSAASNGDLDTAKGVRAQARRMIGDARARDIIVHFFERVLEVERYESIAPSTNQFPEVPSGLKDLALEETRAFLEGIMVDAGGSLRDLLTSTTTYVNGDLATIYGLDGSFDAEWVPVELDPSERSGVLTQVGFLAANATSRDPDPIHRGVFIARRISCLTIAAPPDAVPPLPPHEEGMTNRQLVEGHTEQEGTACAACHATIINPYGFAFENFDATGAYRTMDADQEVDSSAEVLVGSKVVSVEGAIDLTEKLAESPEVHGCFSKHLVSFALGRPTEMEDEPLVSQLGDESLSGGVSFADLMVELSTAISFLNRSALEEP